MKNLSAVALAVAAWWHPLVLAKTGYPSKPVKVVVGLAPGGATDVQARLYSSRLAEQLGHAFVIENRPGGAGLVGVRAVLNSPADGHTLLVVTPTFTISPAFHGTPPYDLKAFAPAQGRRCAP